MSDEKRRSARIPAGHEVFVVLFIAGERVLTRFTDRNVNGIGIEAEGLLLEVGDKIFIEIITITKEGIDFKAVDLLHGVQVRNIRHLAGNTVSYGLEFLSLTENYAFLKSQEILCDMRRLNPLDVISQFLSI